MNTIVDAAPVRVCLWHEDEPCKCAGTFSKYPTLPVQELAERDGWVCSYCYEPTTEKAIREHVVPRSRGGSNLIENLVLACGRCNSRKLHMSIEEWLLLEQRRGRLHELPGLKSMAAEFYRIRRLKASADEPVSVTDALDRYLELMQIHWDEQQMRIRRGWPWRAFAP